MAPAQLLQLRALRTALQLSSKRSLDAALRQRLTDVEIPKTGRLFHTTVLKLGGSGKPYKYETFAQHPETFPYFKDGPDPSRKGGPPGADELLRQGLGPEADDWRNWSPEKMEYESNYLLRLNKTDLDSEENWLSFGHDYHDRIADVAYHRFLVFITVLQIIFVTFVVYYTPDMRHRNWYQREAFLEMARREALGLPLIDPDYIPPEKMLLPTDEELEALAEEPII